MGTPYNPSGMPSNYPPPNAPQPGQPQPGAPSSSYPSAAGSAGFSYRRDNEAQVGVVGLVVSVIGAIVTVLGLTAINWYNLPKAVPIDNTKFTVLNPLAKTVKASFTEIITGPVGWLLIVALIVVAIVATLPTAAAGLLRIVAPVLAVVILAAAVFALMTFWSKAKDAGIDGGIFKNTGLGLWLAIGGLILLGVGGALGSRRN